MSLITEDGTVVTGAESYTSVADADTHHSLRGTTLWDAMTTTEKEQALRRATDFMMGRYRGRWKGGRVHAHQELDWPRQGVVTEDMGIAPAPYFAFVVDYRTIPVEVKRACAELALRAGAGPLEEDEDIRVLEETVGPITTKYDPNARRQIKFSQVDSMLSVYLERGGNSGMFKLSRT